MIRRREAIYIRSGIIGKVQSGKWTADRAEAVAKRLGVGPLASVPHAFMYDPMREEFWTMPMAVAWIAWRTEDAVRDAWDEYRKNAGIGISKNPGAGLKVPSRVASSSRRGRRLQFTCLCSGRLLRSRHA